MFPILRLFLKSFRRMTRRLSLTLVLIIGLGATPATAQITPNGLGTQVNRDGNTFNIHGGTQAGRNLFHSFYQFGLNQGQIANFWSNPAIANILARVNGGSASYINGLIQVLGGRSNLFLMNPSGIVFGPNASLNVPAAFTATTADRILFPGGSFHAYGENNFANLAGDPIGFAFDRKDPAAIVNEANLTATSVSLVAGQAINTGKVTANQITIAAVPGENLVRLSQAGQILSLEFNPQQAASVADASGNIPITRLPELLTGGGVTTVTANPDQTVTLAGVAVPMSSGSALIGGVLDASNAVANGGQVGVFGTNISLVNAEINASGLTGGGEILIGGEFQGKGTQPNALNTWVNSGSILRADAVQVGNGGRIIVWADGTTKFAGSISAKGGQLGGDGGFAEVSGKETLNLAPGWSSRIDLSAPAGKRGTLLLDPNDINISGTAASSTITNPEDATDSGNQLLDDDIVTFLGSNNLTIQTTGPGGSGTITIDGDVDITWSAATTFTLNADQSIVVNSGAKIENTSATTGFDAIVFNANAAGATSGNFVGIKINNATLKANGGNIKLTGKGGDTGFGNYGIYQHSGAQVSTTSGNITYTGTGGNGTNDNVGVFLSGSGTKISSGSGAISITGTGQGINSDNYGILQVNGAQVSTTSGNITYDGTGGNGGNGNVGVFLSGSGTKISSDSGAISITGTGQGTGFNNYGIIQQDSAQVSTTIGNITYTGTGAGTDDAIRTELGSNIIGDNTSGKITLTSTNNGITLNNVTVKTTNNITINSPGNVTQNNIGGLFADGLELLGSGSYDLTNTNNNISTLAANTSNFIKYTDTDGFVVGTVGSTNGVNVGANNLTLEAISGTVTQSEAITASGLELLGSGSYTLTNTANNISTLAANTSNFIKYTDTDGFAIGTVNSTNGISAPGKNVTLTAGGAVTQSQAITASGLELKGAGDYFLINPTNDVNTLTLDNTTGIVSFVDADELSISGVGTLGAVYIVAQGNITQTLDLNTDGSVVLSSVNGNIDATGKNIFSSSGTILLSANTSVTTGDLTALNNIDIIAGTSVTTGDLTAFEDIRITAGTSVTTGDLTAFEDIRITAGTSVTTGDLTAFEDIRITADTSVTTGDLFAFGDIGIDAGTSVTTGDLTAFEDIRITAGTSVTTGDLTALNNIDIIAGTSVTTGALDAFLDILITAINGSITVNGDVGFTNLPNNVIFEAFNEITAKDIKAFKNVDLSNPSPLTTSGILTVGDVTTQIGNIFLFPLQKLEAGNLTSNGGEIFAATSSVDIPSSALDSQGRIENFDYITIFDKLNGGSVKVGNVKSGGGSIVLISPDPDNPIQAGILDSTGSGSSTFEIGSGTKAVEVFIVSNNAIKLDSITAQGTGQINIAARSGFLATDTNTSGFSIQTKGGALIDLQYALTGTFTVGTTTGIGTKGKITNGLITLSPNLTFQCFPTDCGVFNQISIRPTNPTFESAFRPPTPPQRPLPRPDLQRNEIPRLTLSEVDTRQLLDVSEVLRTQLDVATEEGIFSLDVAFGAEFANYLGVKPANTLRSAADVRKLLEDIYKQTGRKTAVVYWVLDQLYLNIVLITPGVPQGIAQKQGIVVASVDLTTGLVQQPTTAPLIYRGVPTARRDEVLRVIDRFRSQVTDRRSRDYLKDAQALYRWLIEPIEPELQAQGIDTLLVVPDKGIRLLPLGALYDGKQFLIEKYNVAMTPSVNLISTRYRPLQGAEVLAMGASTFADERSLPSVPIELKTITSIWPGRYFLNQDFTPERLVQEHKTGQFRIVHLATHATFKPGDLSESYIVFGNNQKLPVTKLPELSLKGVELFSLGACRTLIGDTTDPTVEFGFAGLAVKTGVETAVASLWNVEDTPTMALMTEFYRYLQKTPIKAEALRQAQLALMQGQTRIEIEGGQLRLVTRSGQSIPLPPELANIRDLDFSHPYFWSGFSMIGSPW
jgi:filamentous hemagglutinin family protein